jgi:hypothetical protein
MRKVFSPPGRKSLIANSKVTVTCTHWIPTMKIIAGSFHLFQSLPARNASFSKSHSAKNYAVEVEISLRFFLFNGCLSAWWSKCIKLKSSSFSKLHFEKMLSLDRVWWWHELLNIISQMKLSWFEWETKVGLGRVAWGKGQVEVEIALNMGKPPSWSWVDLQAELEQPSRLSSMKLPGWVWAEFQAEFEQTSKMNLSRFPGWTRVDFQAELEQTSRLSLSRLPGWVWADFQDELE